MSLPQQFEALDRGWLDIGVGLARFAPEEISTARLALDPAGVFVGTKHPWASLRSIPVRELRSVILLRGDGDQAPEYNDFVVELCRREGFSPNTRPGRVDGVRAAIYLVKREDVAFCAPRAVWPLSPDVRWVALADPVVHYKQSVLSDARRRSRRGVTTRGTRTRGRRGTSLGQEHFHHSLLLGRQGQSRGGVGGISSVSTGERS